ncbi:MAG TPA: glycosyltransferase family 39 protein [Blastocatellia bacterium]|nr:glycosyltransferase family 39 protein [Blastocatellia bacterium]
MAEYINRFRDRIARRLTSDPARVRHARRERVSIGIMMLIVFATALTVRLLRWEDNRDSLKFDPPVFSVMDSQYKIEVRRMIKEAGLLFPREHDPESPRMLNHPPGYAMLLLWFYGDSFNGHRYERLKLLQAICDSVAALVVVAITLQILPMGAAAIAGLLVALSPQLAFYSLWGTPDSISVLPLLVAVYLLILAIKKPNIWLAIASGALIGVSCWLRANAMVLAPFLAITLSWFFPKGLRVKYAAAIVCAAAILIAPITIRNWVVFHHFVPLSLRAGINLVEGIAEYDEENRFGMPASLKFILQKDVEWHGRPDYGSNQWQPDGFMRERYRLSRGLEVARQNPLWFAGMMARRAGTMLRYNDSLVLGEGADTCKVPLVSAEASFAHQQSGISQAAPVWSADPTDMLSAGGSLSSKVKTALQDDGHWLEIAGDESAYDDQFVSPLISVKKDTDYVLKVSARMRQGLASIKLTTPDRKVSLSQPITFTEPAREQKEAGGESTEGVDEVDSKVDEHRFSESFEMPFASGKHDHVLLVVGNNGRSISAPITQIGSVELIEIGRTPHSWVRPLRPVFRVIQRNVFRTQVMLPLAFAGLVLLAIARKWREMAIILAMPVYYLCFQSALYTEYRYILAIHYFVPMLVAVTVYWALSALKSRAYQGTTSA